MTHGQLGLPLPSWPVSRPGCRGSRARRRSIPVELAECLYFATESAVWTGGRGFYDPTGPGRMRARAHLLTVDQVSEIAAQEMYREPGADLDELTAGGSAGSAGHGARPVTGRG